MKTLMPETPLSLTTAQLTAMGTALGSSNVGVVVWCTDYVGGAQLVKWNGVAWSALDTTGGGATVKNYIAVFGGAGVSSVGVGTTCFVAAVQTGTVLGWKLISPSSVTCVVNVWKANGSIPTAGNLISNSLPPTLTAATIASSTNLTGWTNTTVAAGDVFGFELSSLSETTNSITLSLEVG